MKQSVNVFDFDDTIYKGQSLVDFLKYCLKNQPFLWFFVVGDVIRLFKIKYHLAGEKTMKKSYLSCLKRCNNVDQLIDTFRKKNDMKIMQRYKDIYNEDDIIITTSPEFLLQHFCKKYPIKAVIGSKIDQYTGVLTGTICLKEEKVKRFRRLFPDQEIQNFYTDEVINDEPLIAIAKTAYVINKKWKLKQIK